MPRASRVCGRADCPHLVPHGQACPDHPRQHRAPDTRPSAAARGYGANWTRYIRPSYLRRHPTCTDCGAPSQVPDHDPISRRELIARGEQHPDADEHLLPRCIPCHNRRTATLRA